MNAATDEPLAERGSSKAGHHETSTEMGGFTELQCQALLEAATGKTPEEYVRQLQEMSRRAEKRYRQFLDFLPYPVSVFDKDSTVSYINTAFERVFGWSLSELKGKRIPFVPGHLRRQTREGISQMIRDKVIHGFETQRLTKDGRLLDIVLDGALLFDEMDRPAGQVVTFWDVTQQLRADRSHNVLFRISKALYQFRGLDQRLDYITRKILNLLRVEGALVILVDEEKKEFFFRSTAYDSTDAQARYKETRFPIEKGVTGEVYRTGKPMVVEDYYNSPYFFPMVDEQTGVHTRNMIQVPMRAEDRIMGVLCAVNKKEGEFDKTDVELLSTIASIVVLPIVNASINEALNRSYEELKSLNRAKDRVIHHLSHELKTPLSVIDASVSLLEKRNPEGENSATGRIVARCRRNLQRLLEMQYEIEDIMKGKNYAIYPIVNRILDASIDVIESIAETQEGSANLGERIRQKIDRLFGPRDAPPERIVLGRFVGETLDSIVARFGHRRVEVVRRIASGRSIFIPVDVLKKVVGGLIRNAVENTPDGGRIEVSVEDRGEFVDLTVQDSGVGITQQDQQVIFENYFTSKETMAYSTRDPFDFDAGGKGFDLLRMKIFSERYGFNIRLTSDRCKFIPDETDRCPGDVGFCIHCSTMADCLTSGGTKVAVSFPSADPQEGEPVEPEYLP